MKGRQFNVAVVGLGYWGPNLARNFHKHPGFKLKWICDVNKRRLLSVSGEYPSPQATVSYGDILNDDSVDVVALAIPPHLHYELASRAVSRGKHLWLEKPFTTSLKDGKKLVRSAYRRGLKIHVDYPYVFYGPFRKMKSLIEKNGIGKPYYYTSFRSNLGLIQEKVDIIWDLAPHDLSILFYLFPKMNVSSIISSGSSFIYNKKSPEIAHVILKCADGFTAYLHLSWLSPVKWRVITIGGSRKMIVLDDIQPEEKIKVYTKSIHLEPNKITTFNPIYRIGDAYIPTYDKTEAIYEGISYFHAVLSGRTKEDITVKIALKSLKLLEEISRRLV